MGYLQRASINSEGVHVANGPRYSASVTPAYPTRGMSRSPNLRGSYNGSPLGCHVTSTSYRPSRSCGVRLEDRHVFLSAFDLLELNGQDLRRKIKERKRLLPKLVPNAKPGLREDIAEAGDLVFRYACELGLSGEPFMGRIPARDRGRGPVVRCAIVAHRGARKRRAVRQPCP